MKPDPKQTLKKVGLLFISFVLTYALLRLIIHLSEAYTMPIIYYVGTTIYGAAVVILFVAFFVLNGFTLGREEYEMDDLPERWDERRKRTFIEHLPENREKAKTLLYILLPLILTLLLSYIELSFFA